MPLEKGEPQNTLSKNKILSTATSCENCEKSFTRKRPWQKFCSSLCRWNNWDKKHPRTDVQKDKE